MITYIIITLLTINTAFNVWYQITKRNEIKKLVNTELKEFTITRIEQTTRMFDDRIELATRNLSRLYEKANTSEKYIANRAYQDIMCVISKDQMKMANFLLDEGVINKHQYLKYLEQFVYPWLPEEKKNGDEEDVINNKSE